MIPSLELIRSLAVEIGVATPNRHEDAETRCRRRLGQRAAALVVHLRDYDWTSRAGQKLQSIVCAERCEPRRSPLCPSSHIANVSFLAALEHPHKVGGVFLDPL
jgi:hypothetical protein